MNLLVGLKQAALSLWASDLILHYEGSGKGYKDYMWITLNNWKRYTVQMFIMIVVII